MKEHSCHRRSFHENYDVNIDYTVKKKKKKKEKKKKTTADFTVRYCKMG